MLIIKSAFIPEINNELRQLAAVFTTSCTGAQYCLSPITWLNDSTLHQFNRDKIIFETAKDQLESLTYKLDDHIYDSINSHLYGKLTSSSRFKSTILIQLLIPDIKGATKNYKQVPPICNACYWKIKARIDSLSYKRKLHSSVFQQLQCPLVVVFLKNLAGRIKQESSTLSH